jgi:aspartate carbamoyltransferase catalytic subunit
MTSRNPFSFLDTKDLGTDEIGTLFLEAKKIKEEFLKTGNFPAPVLFMPPFQPLVALLFFEASTRTRLSFEMAIQRLGGTNTFFDGASKEGTSLIKGETFEDTFWTLHSMLPDAIIVRCGDELDLHKLREQATIPLINAGFGTKSHPTQALLDVFTMLESFPTLNGKNVLFIGDIRHSRVAHSHMELLPRLHANIGVAGPDVFMHGLPADLKRFDRLEDGLQWADVIVGLRVQFERHAGKDIFSRDEFIARYQVTKEHGRLFKKDALLFHPGPVNWGVEFDPSVRELPNFKMWDQKQNGVFVRAALLDAIFRKNGRTHVSI